jgi:hypothetical protein
VHTSTLMLCVILRRRALSHADVPAPHLAAVSGPSGPGHLPGAGHQPAWSRPAVLPAGSVLPDAG